MTTPTLHVHTHSDKNTIEYVRFMWETMRALASRPDTLRLSVHCVGGHAAQALGTLVNAAAYVVPNVDDSSTGSTAHGMLIDHALAMTGDGDLHLNVDSDTVVLARGWDDFVRLQMIDERVGLLGATFEDIGGFSSGTGKSQTFKGIPYTAWMAMTPFQGWADLSAMPDKPAGDVEVTTIELSQTYGLPVGHSVLRDVGWRIPAYVRARNLRYVGWKHLKPSGDAVVLRGLSDYHEEFHAAPGVPFVAHQRGSLRHRYRDGQPSAAFYEACDRWLAIEKAHAPRWTWEENDANRPLLAALAVLKAGHAVRTAGTPGAPAEPKATATTPGGTTIDGWLKATFDGNGVWSRYVNPVPKDISVTFQPDMLGRGNNLRLEGTTPAILVRVPGAADRAYLMTVRNMMGEPATVRTTDDQRSVAVPPGACWGLLVDVDGVVKVD